MNLDHLKYIVGVAKTGSLSGASQQLHVSQSALSQSISHMEGELGVRIFNRSRTGTVPTETGIRIIKKAAEILDKLQELESEADKNLIHGELRIGTIPGSASMISPKTLATYNKDYPNIQIVITEKASQDIIDDIKNDKLDLGLVGLTREGKGQHDEKIDLEVVLRGQMIVAANRHSPLAISDSATPEDIRKYPMVIYNDDRMLEFIEDFAAQFGAVHILFSTNNMDAVRNAVLDNVAITIGPDYTVNNDFYVLNGDAVPIKIDELKQEYPGMALARPKTKHISAHIHTFISKLKAQMNGE